VANFSHEININNIFCGSLAEKKFLVRKDDVIFGLLQRSEPRSSHEFFVFCMASFLEHF
jgi:hypothetical protein